MENKISREIANNKKQIKFNKSTKYIFEKKEGLLDEGKANIGYTIEEAIMEAIDDSLDGKAANIQIKLFEEIFTEFKENGNFDDGTMARRCSYVVCDNGIGMKSIKEIFNFGNKTNIKYKDRNEYLTKNSRFHYGCISHINVGSQIIFYSKTITDDKWKEITLNYDRYVNCGYISNVRYVTEKEKKVLGARGIRLPHNSGSLIYVRGIRKMEFDFSDIESLRANLVKQVGITYCTPLNGQCNITIDDTNVIGLNPLGEELTDKLIKPNLFGKYEISLREIFSKLDDNIAKEELISKFKEVFSNEEELLNETIKIKLVSINENFTYKHKKIKEKFPNLNDVYFPKLCNSGFYIKRNNRYIGRALGMLGIIDDHPSYNRFRGEISFNPIFDEFFKIQINKNRNSLSKILKSLIEEKIRRDNQLQGSTVGTKIQIAIGANKQKNIHKSKIPVKNSLEDKIKKLKDKAKGIKRNLENYYQDTNKVDIVLNLLEGETLVIDEIARLERLYAEYQKKYKCIYKDVTFLIKRITINKKKKMLKNIKQFKYIDIFSLIREPKQEGELYGVFYLMYVLFPDKFDFHLIDYDTNEGLDCLVEINSQLFNELNFQERFGNQIEKINDELEISKEEAYNKEVRYNNKMKVCYLELKVNLKEKMNHSLVFVSHIVCWDKPKIDQLQADDDMYVFTDLTKTLLINSSEGVSKKVKVIYLKDMIENITYGKFRK